MNIQEEIKKIDHEFVRLIVAGEFEMVEIEEYTTTISCGGSNLTFWMKNGADSIRSYYIGGFISDSPSYLILNLTRRRAIYRVLSKLKDPVAEAAALKEKKAQFLKLKEELGET